MPQRRRVLRLLAGFVLGLLGGYAAGLVREPRPGSPVGSAPPATAGQGR
jgi:hypothetical protein